MNKVFLTLSLLMGFIVLISNFLVQFPVNSHFFDMMKLYKCTFCFSQVYNLPIISE